MAQRGNKKAGTFGRNGFVLRTWGSGRTRKKTKRIGLAKEKSREGS